MNSPFKNVIFLAAENVTTHLNLDLFRDVLLCFSNLFAKVRSGVG